MEHWKNFKEKFHIILHKVPYRPLAIVLVLVICLGVGISRLRIEPANQGKKNKSQVEILTGQSDKSKKGSGNKSSDQEDTDQEDAGQESDQSKTDSSQNQPSNDTDSDKGSDKGSDAKTSGKSSKTSSDTAEDASRSKKAGEQASQTQSSGSSNETKSSDTVSASTSSASREAAGAGNGGSKTSAGKSSASTAQNPTTFQVSMEIQCRSVSGENSGVSDPTALERIHALNQGEILKANVTLSPGDSVYTALVKATQAANIEMGARDTQYGVYIYEINYLREKMAGPGSGWMYSVNGTPPNKGCAGYYPTAGDKIEFFYVK